MPESGPELVPASLTGAARPPLRVLLVDDHAMMRAGFRLILEAADGIEVAGEASTGAEGVAAAARLQPDVICMDVQMPDMDGLEATRRIVADPSLDAAVLIVTTFDRDDYLFAALTAGAAGFLLKNAGPEELVRAVRVAAAGDALLSPEVTRRVIARFADGGAAAAASAPAGSAAAASAPAPSVQQSSSAAADARDPQKPTAEHFRARATPVRQSLSATSPAEDPQKAPAEQGGAAADPASAAPTVAATRESVPPVDLTEREAEVLRLMSDALSNAEIAQRLYIGEATVKTHVSNVLAKLGARDRVQAVVLAYRRGMA